MHRSPRGGVLLTYSHPSLLHLVSQIEGLVAATGRRLFLKESTSPAYRERGVCRRAMGGPAAALLLVDSLRVTSLEVLSKARSGMSSYSNETKVLGGLHRGLLRGKRMRCVGRIFESSEHNQMLGLISLRCGPVSTWATMTVLKLR